jgi:tight adherence protein B
MDTQLLLAGASAGAAVALFFVYFYSRAVADDRIVSSRIANRGRDFEFAPASSLLREQRGSFPLVRMLPLSPEAVDRMTGELARAGWSLTVHEYLASRLAAAAAGCIIGILLVKRTNIEPALLEWPLVIALAFGGWLLPRLALNRARQRRLERIEEQLPDALMSIAKSLRAGAAILQALTYAANETPAPLGQELQRTIRDLQLGVEAEDAFADLSARVGSRDLDIAVTAIVIQRTVGGNLSEILSNVTNTIRERASLHREVRVMTTRQRLTGNMVAAVPVLIALFMMVVNPSMFQLLTHTVPGRIGLAFGIFFEVVGIMLMRKFSKIEV